jgi:hypothetical protein
METHACTHHMQRTTHASAAVRLPLPMRVCSSPRCVAGLGDILRIVEQPLHGAAGEDGVYDSDDMEEDEGAGVGSGDTEASGSGEEGAEEGVSEEEERNEGVGSEDEAEEVSEVQALAHGTHAWAHACRGP